MPVRVIRQSPPRSTVSLPRGTQYVKTTNDGRHVYHLVGTGRWFVCHQTSAGWVTVELEGGCGC